MRRTRTRYSVALATALMVAGALTVFACSDANDVAGCRELEDVRCERAESCGIDLQYPLHPGDSEADNIQACKLFYQDACLHGLVTTLNLSAMANAGDMAACVSAITTGNCNIVINPQLSPACMWLNPFDAGIDAPPDVSIPDTGTPVVVDATIGVDAGEDAALKNCFLACDQMCATGDSVCLDNCEEECTTGS